MEGLSEGRAYLDIGLGQFSIEYSGEEQHLGSHGQLCACQLTSESVD